MSLKEDFYLTKNDLSQIGILRISQDFYLNPRHRGANYFVKSPATDDKTWSLALYPKNNRFCDFANGGLSGDSIAFVAYIQGCNQWQALKDLRAFYGLADSREQERQDAQRRIRLQQQEEQKKVERKQAFYTALRGEIDRLKRWADSCRLAIEKSLYEPFSNMWMYCMNELQKIEYKLDVLTGADYQAYPRLKVCSANVPSDRFQWLLDCLAILTECEAFEATVDEIREITLQRDFELTRQPGVERRCGIEW